MSWLSFLYLREKNFMYWNLKEAQIQIKGEFIRSFFWLFFALKCIWVPWQWNCLSKMIPLSYPQGTYWCKNTQKLRACPGLTKQGGHFSLQLKHGGLESPTREVGQYLGALSTVTLPFMSMKVIIKSSSSLKGEDIKVYPYCTVTITMAFRH